MPNAAGKAFDYARFNALPVLSEDETPLPENTPVIYNLFASWCAPCLAELPELAQLKATYDITLIGIAWNDKPERTNAWLEKHGNPYDQIRLDENGGAGISLGMRGLPESFIVGPDGIILAYYSGAMTIEMIEEYLLAALSAPPKKKRQP